MHYREVDQQPRVEKGKNKENGSPEVSLEDLDEDEGEDINKNNRGRYEGKLGGNDLYFESLDPGCDISKDEGNNVESDEVEDPPTRNATTKLYMIFVNNVEFRESLQTYCIQKGENLQQKPNEKARIRAKCRKGCPW
ncbi:hypothetical protein KY290_007739 [Solanum tuberosum]|uniref:Transposase MuDR plant domain-containing protein n=1 Tax=Solanum tuberosum TaxID=4113 RepID=A0ABQ7W6J3_SOLTU|nr:hypothetical protein KY290_007739 [Solanum tuberosum]